MVGFVSRIAYPNGDLYWIAGSSSRGELTVGLEDGEFGRLVERIDSNIEIARQKLVKIVRICRSESIPAAVLLLSVTVCVQVEMSVGAEGAFCSKG